ncbi:hypothetical protein [Mycolicibacterium llatzerense]|uniref:hypothetical protein n=1 Tax=Mycolicibacterium llatzerense TaxID=280871 RepID=UPI0021B63860|nr:hypothetical protein [Mycolicibacterium llatzerense]
MPRIRTIKPRFWDSPSTAQADLAPRLVFMAMWNWADDSGRGTANLKELEAFAFPNDTVTTLPRRSCANCAGTGANSAGGCGTWRSFGHILAEVQKCYGVVFYRVLCRNYFVIPSFKAHQSKDFKPNSGFPSPDEGEIWDLTRDFPEYTCSSGDSSAQFAQPVAEDQLLAAENRPLDRDKDGDRDGDESRPPVRTEQQTARANDGRGKALAVIREANLTARSVDAYRIAEAFSASLPVPIEAGLLAGIGTQIDKCLKRDIPPQAIAAGLKAWTDSDSWSPTQIPNFVHKANNRRPANGVGKPTEKALGYDAALTELLQEVQTL